MTTEPRDRLAAELRRIAQIGLATAGVLLVVGLILGWTGRADLSHTCLLAGLGVLVSLPVVNVVAELVEELRRREWIFLLATVAVIAILLFNVMRAF